MPTALRICLTRDIAGPDWTLGTVELDLPGDGEGFLPYGFSVEDVDRRVEEDITRKVPGETAIPIGTYPVRLYDSPRHGPQTPELVGVPGFHHIQLHSGNSADHTEGCLLVGLTRDTTRGTVGRSRIACRWLRTLIVDVITAGGTVTVEVRRA